MPTPTLAYSPTLLLKVSSRTPGLHPRPVSSHSVPVLVHRTHPLLLSHQPFLRLHTFPRHPRLLTRPTPVLVNPLIAHRPLILRNPFGPPSTARATTVVN